MFWFSRALQWSGVLLLISILLLIGRQRLYRRFPLFAAYIAYVILETVLCSVFLSKPHIYFYVYWSTEPGAFILRILAVHESFMQVFRSFYLLKWFRVLFPGTITVSLVSSGWHAYTHPAHASPVGAAIIGTAVTAQYIVLSISILFFALVNLVRVPWRIHEYRIVLGFGVSSLAISFAGAVRSEFGTGFEPLSRMLPGVAYILALVVWLSAATHSLPASVQLSGERVSPEAVLSEVRRQLLVIRSFLRKG
jgi:hypothetical protein